MTKHRPVLLREVLDIVKPQPSEAYLDVTAGYGGHAQAILSDTKNPEDTILIDRDSEAADELKKLFGTSEARIVNQDFLSASKELAAGGKRFDIILADLGLSSPHLEDAGRGFSLKRPGPLDMRMDRRQEITAADIVNSASEGELTRIFSEYGEEPKSRQFARRIVQSRPIKSTDQLAAIAETLWRSSRQHPATRIFQAIRIAVNDELNQLEQALPLWLEMLTPGGRMVMISFHSLEDRIVKRFFSDHSSSLLEGELRLLTKKPVTASNDEIVSNPRARSAKLRAAAKIKTKRKD